MNRTKFPGKPRRLKSIHSSYSSPLFFVTFVTGNRRRILASNSVHDAFRNFARRNEVSGIAVGRYVIMPDHVHMFVRLDDGLTLSQTVRLIKRTVSAAVGGGAGKGSLWQRGFFDHLLRHGESYAEKWEYVEQNPVRAGLVSSAEEWPYQGEVVKLTVD